MDFDGTLYQKDSFITFILASFTLPKITVAFFILLPDLIKMFLRLETNSNTKQLIFRYFFKGMGIYEFNHICYQFKSKIEKNVNYKVLDHIKLVNESTPIIVSASIRNWIEPWAHSVGIEQIIATEVEIDETNRLTGRFTTENCNGIEKVHRIKSFFENSKVEFIAAYGNSKGDFPMFEIAKSAFLIRKQKIIKFK